jgi:hypothetical protein
VRLVVDALQFRGDSPPLGAAAPDVHPAALGGEVLTTLELPFYDACSGYVSRTPSAAAYTVDAAEP